MKKVYSQKASTEVFALAPEQLAVFKSAGYETPTAEEAIADAGAVKLTPPEGKRAYVAFDFKAGEFFVRVKTCTLRGSEYSNLIKELIEAALLRGQVVQADPDRPKAAAPAAGENVSPFVSLLTEGLKKSFTEGLAKSLLGSLVGAAFMQTPPTAPPASSQAAGQVAGRSSNEKEESGGGNGRGGPRSVGWAYEIIPPPSPGVWGDHRKRADKVRGCPRRRPEMGDALDKARTGGRVYRAFRRVHVTERGGAGQ